MEERKIEGAVSHEVSGDCLLMFGPMADADDQVYYSAAVACLSTLTSHHSLATVQALLLLETYSIWHARSEISTWQVAGLALRTAIELGLHRRTRSKAERQKDPLRYEMKKRVFWTVYTMDRYVDCLLHLTATDLAACSRCNWVDRPVSQIRISISSSR